MKCPGPCVLLALLTALASTLTPLRAELIGYWSLDEAEGDTAVDQINGNDGVWQNFDANLEWTDGRIGGAARLTDGGGDNFFRIETITQLVDSDALTISVWIDPEPQMSSNYNGIVMTRTINGREDNSWGVAIEADHLDTRVDGPGIDSPNGALTPALGWIHLAMVWNGAEGSHVQYVNGEETSRNDAAYVGTILDTSGPWYIGYDDCCGDNRDFDGLIDEVAMWNEALDAADIGRLAAGFSPIGLGVDDDEDGLPNDYEEGLAFLDPKNPADAALDQDEDGLSNLAEFEHGSNPEKADTDEDGLTDGAEVNEHGTDPARPDSDADGLTDGEEVLIHMTDPNLADSDGDGIGDASELEANTDPNDASSPPPPAPGLIGAWTFDEGSGGVAADSVYENDGVWQNEDQVDLEWVDGIIGGAAKLTDSGANSFFRIDTIGQLVGAEALTISAWIDPEPQSSSNYNGIMMTRTINNRTGNSWGVAIEDDHLDTRVEGPGIDSPEATLLADDGWYHVVLVWDGISGTHTQYINGEEISTGGAYTGPINGTSGPWYLGYDDCCGDTRDFDGFLDDVSLWNIALDAGAVREIYENGLAGISVVSAGDFRITEIAPSAGNAISLTWTSTPGQFYNVQRSADLLDWQEILSKLPATDGPADTTTTSLEREPFAAFYRVAQTEPPAALETGFEDGAPGWTASLVDGFDATATSWEVGVPSNGPGAAHSGENVYGTGLAADYAEGTAIALRSPPIDLAGTTNVRLTFWHYLDIVEGEGGRVNMLEEDGSLIQNLEPLFASEALNTTEWTEFSLRLPNLEPARPFRLEFQFLSGGDTTPNRAGWFIDDVRVGR